MYRMLQRPAIDGAWSSLSSSPAGRASPLDGARSGSRLPTSRGLLRSWAAQPNAADAARAPTVATTPPAISNRLIMRLLDPECHSSRTAAGTLPAIDCPAAICTAARAVDSTQVADTAARADAPA